MTQPQGGFGPYELLDPLGRGGMGVVWRARSRGGGELVALGAEETIPCVSPAG